MNKVTLRYPKQLSFGNGVLKDFVEDYLQLGFNKLFVVTFPEILQLLEENFTKLKKNGVEIYYDTSIISEPTYKTFEAVLGRAREFGADSIAGIGGGSSMDVAKLIAAQIKNEQTTDEIIGTGNLKERLTYLTCIPTTSGTGSEVSPNAILLDESDNLKKGVVSPYLIADAAYVDPELTYSVPPKVTAATGLDALIHCIEEYTNVFSHPVVDVYALEGIRLIGANLVKAYQNGKDVEAREKVALGSLYGGLGLGPVNTAAVHALSYPLGGEFHIPHGLSNAVLLPYVMKFNMVASPRKYADVAVALGAKRETSDLKTAEKGVQKVFELCQALDVPVKLSELNIPKDAIGRMVEGAMKVTRLLRNNPRPLTAEDAEKIYSEAY